MLVFKHIRSCYCFLTSLPLWFFWILSTNADPTVQIGMFVDRFCQNAAPINPSFSIPLNVCVQTPGALAFNGNNAICADGNAVKFLVYYNSACGGDSFYTYYSSFLNCHDNNDNPLPGFVAYCGSQNQLQIASTTRIPAATNLISAPSSTSAGGKGATTTQQGQQATGSSNSSDGSAPHGWNALTNGERIGAIIALAVGIPAVLIAAAGLCIACR